ncbi:MAG: 50S ribosomal protein L22 [Dehalococcoidia bacterium]|nr:50S ribosomal protein L22 [Dehalococcoidia bacterium]
MPEVRAVAKRVGVSPRKVRLIIDLIRGKRVAEALTLLQFLPQPSARDVAKVVKSAAANAENNNLMDPDRLVIVRAFADDGPSLRRFRARSRGRVSPIRRRTSHITVYVDERR